MGKRGRAYKNLSQWRPSCASSQRASLPALLQWYPRHPSPSILLGTTSLAKTPCPTALRRASIAGHCTALDLSHLLQIALSHAKRTLHAPS